MRSPSLVLALLLAFHLGASPLRAQDPPPPPMNNVPPTAVVRTDAERALVRALLDLQKVTAHLEEQDHGFQGAWRLLQANSPDPSRIVDYVGAALGPLQLLRLADHAILTAGDQLRVWRGGSWRRCDGDEPECPLAPRTLLKHLVDAEIDTAMAVTLDDRPVQRVHAIWRTKAARALLDALTAPGEVQRTIEGLAEQAERIPDDQLVLDAVLYYDPAQHQLRKATLRLALLAATQPERFAPLPAAAGFPALPRPILIAMEFELSITAPTAATWPGIDDETRAELRLATQPAAAKPPATKQNTPSVTPK